MLSQWGLLESYAYRSDAVSRGSVAALRIVLAEDTAQERGAGQGIGAEPKVGACSPYKIDLTLNLFRWTFAYG